MKNKTLRKVISGMMLLLLFLSGCQQTTSTEEASKSNLKIEI